MAMNCPTCHQLIHELGGLSNYVHTQLVYQLTPTERRAADLVMVGKSNREIAVLLNTTEQYVKNVLGRVYRKLGIKGRVSLALVMKDWVRWEVERLKEEGKR